MNWFYVVGDQQAGPVSDAELDALFRSGKINQNTQVWREGMTAWQPLSTARPITSPSVSGGEQGVVCAECGRTFPPDEVITLNNSRVCASCKPIFLQRIREGAMPSGVVGLWRTKNQLVTRSETPFPDRCVRCNAPANGYRLKRQLFWHPPAYFLLIFCNLLIYAIVAVCVRKKAIVHIGLCERHRVGRKRGIVVCWVGVLGGLGMIIGGGMNNSGLVILPGIILLLVGIIYGAVTGARISAAKITKENVWIKGVNKDLLAELPEWTGP